MTSGARTAGRQLGPIRLWPGSPTLAPLVVNATELGSWTALSTIATPTAAIDRKHQSRNKNFHGHFLTFDLSRPDYSAGTACGVRSDGAPAFACSSSTQSE